MARSLGLALSFPRAALRFGPRQLERPGIVALCELVRNGGSLHDAAGRYRECESAAVEDPRSPVRAWKCSLQCDSGKASSENGER
jgi:hypothetical protein